MTRVLGIETEYGISAPESPEISVELLAAAVGIELLAAMSAPTALAVELAQASGLTLAAFVRKQRYGLYSHPARVPDSAPQH